MYRDTIQNLVIIGGGPAGLSAAINAASELSHVVLCDSGRKNFNNFRVTSYGRELGGQAIGSTAIENYAGFPDGVTGCDLMQRFEIQAQRLGTEILCPHHAVRLEIIDRGLKQVTTREGEVIVAKAILLANGLSYRKLDAPGVKELLGHGVLYGSPTYPAERLGACTVCVLGGANSAGQAVMHLSRNRQLNIKLLVRGKKKIDEQMSLYLVKRIKDCSNVEVLHDWSVAEAIGNEKLESLRIRSGDGSEQVMNVDHLFIYIGAAPKAEWLNGAVQMNDRSFVATGTALGTLFGPKLPYETSLPGVFAAGDIRFESVKRVAAAAGEGSSAVSNIHRYLAGTLF
jgi:thioredoxin reductase (NADPH)